MQNQSPFSGQDGNDDFFNTEQRAKHSFALSCLQIASCPVIAALIFDSHAPLNLGFSQNGLVLNGPLQQLQLLAASAIQTGALKASDWVIFNNKQNALGYIPENIANKGVANGYAPLDATAKIPSIFLPSIAFTNVYVVATLAARNALTGLNEGDVAVVLDAQPDTPPGISATYIWTGSSWVALNQGSEVYSVNGFTGTVNLTTSNISEGTNLYYLDSRAVAAMTGAISTVTTTNLTTSRAVVSNGIGKIVSSVVTSAELAFVSGVTSGIQAQFNAITAILPTLQPLNSYLTALSGTSTTGFYVIQSPTTSTTRSIIGTAGRISVINNDGTGGNPTIDLVTTAVIPGSYGNASSVSTFSVDAYGRLTAASTIPISINTSQVTGRGDITAASPKITLGGTPVGSVFTSVSFDVNEASLTLGNLGGILPGSKGGTGMSTYNTGELLVGQAPNLVDVIATVGLGNVLRSGGIGVMPIWGQVDLTTDVTNLLPISHGGTGASTASLAINNLLPSQAGHVGNQLVTDGVNVSWAPLPVGTVTSVGLSLPSEFTITISPITSSGVLTAIWTSQTANKFLASPSGASGVPSFRGIQNIDLPISGVTAGTYNNITVNAEGIVTLGTNLAYLLANQTVTLSGDVTGSGSTAITTTIGANKVLYSMIQQIPALSLIGNSLGATGNVSTINLNPRLVFSGANIDLSASGVTASTYGSAAQVPVFSVDVYGRVTSVTNTTISIPASSITAANSVTAGSTKITLGGTPANSVLLGFSIDVNEANLTLNNIGGTLSVAKGGTGSTTSNGALTNLLPNQTGNAGKVLSTDGTNTSWVAGSVGTVSSVGLVLPSIFNVTVTPITTSGNLTAVLNTQSANTVFAGPSSGAASAPTFRALVNLDLPTSGVVAGSAYNNFTVNAQGIITAASTVAYLTANQTITLSGDVTGSGTTAITTAIATNAVTYAKFQQVSANRLLGNPTGALANVSEIALAANLVFSAGVLQLSTTGVSAATYGSTTQIPQFTVDGFGRISSVTNVILQPVATNVTSPAGVTTPGSRIIFGGNNTNAFLRSWTIDINEGGLNINNIGGGPLSAINGGTGLASYAIGDILYANTTTTLASLPDVATGNVLLSGGVGVAPSYGKVGLTTHVTGTLAVGNGGTGTATAFTLGSIVFAGASGVYAQNNANFFWDNINNRLGIGTTTPSVSLNISKSIAGIDGITQLNSNVGTTSLSRYAINADTATFFIDTTSSLYTASAEYAANRTVLKASGANGLMLSAPTIGIFPGATSFPGFFALSNTANRTYTFKDASGTVAFLSDILSGTVTSVSVVSANGFAGTVATATTTPAITISTTITGLLKGNGTAISAAVANTDYQSPISLTVTGSSGAATFAANVLNIPTYTLAGLGGQPLATNLTSLAALTFASTSFVKMTAVGTFALDTNTYLTANQTITLTGNVTGSGTTSIATTIANLAVTNAMIANSTIDLTAKVTGLLPLANGGSNANLTAVNGGVVYSTATAMAITAAGTSGQVLTSNGAAAPTWQTVSSGVTSANYVFAYDTTTQTVATANTFQDVTFDTNAIINGWTHTTSTASFTAAVTGNFTITIDAIANATGGASFGIEFRIVKNGTEVSGSQIYNTAQNNNSPQTITGKCLVAVTSGDVIKVQMTAGKTNGQILSSNGNSTVKPSIKINISRIS
jgi:hypothetical protein